MSFTTNNSETTEDADKTNNSISFRPTGQDQGKFNIQVSPVPVCRFPPEPSGYLHIGHAKAAFLNEHFSKKGFLRVRFDDTNPLKETQEFESSILEDIGLLNIKNFYLTHSSDYYNSLEYFCYLFIKEGLGYADNTSVEKMRQERDLGVESINRNNSIEDNIKVFNGMRNRSNLDYCIRAKIDMLHLNKSMRDPVIYRFNFTEHYIYKDRYFLYPTYDFACPIIDSIESITDVFRSNEYRDRNLQYNWFISKAFYVQEKFKESEEEIEFLKKDLEIKSNRKIVEDAINNYSISIGTGNNSNFIKNILKGIFGDKIKSPISNAIGNALDFGAFENIKDLISESDLVKYNYYTLKSTPNIIDFSRLAFENTILSKRNLKDLIINYNLSWDDPRMPTLRGIKRKGLDFNTLKEYILMQGIAQKTATFSWDKLWALNKKNIDEKSPRFFCIEKKYALEFKITTKCDFFKQLPLHRKNTALGYKNTFFGTSIFLDSRDTNLLSENEEFTLMYFNTAIIKNNQLILTNNDERKCKNKFHWVSLQTSSLIKLVEYSDLLINNTFNENGIEESWGYVENAVENVSGFVQFERMGFFYKDGPGRFHLVPSTRQLRKIVKV